LGFAGRYADGAGRSSGSELRIYLEAKRGLRFA
jgi:hypothetical protein